MRYLVAIALLLTFLAGCADEEAPPDDTVGEDLDLKATKDTGVIRGVVIDPTITPIVGAKVAIDALKLETTTNEKGEFGFSEVEPGVHFLSISAKGYNATSGQGVTVEAGVERPPAMRIVLVPSPTLEAMWVPFYFKGYLTCGAAIGYTSVGCTTFADVANLLGDQSIFPHDYERLPNWTQGELVWKSTQTLSGAFIWEITLQGSNGNIAVRETAPSPALTYMTQDHIDEAAEGMMNRGINFRFFGGPHEMCPATGYPNTFGCGVTLEQPTEVFVHDFYNHIPPEGWRLTSEGDPPIPE